MFVCLFVYNRGRIEKAKMGISRRKDELSMPVSSKKDEPEAKKRREDMDDEEGKMFDNWIDEIKIKRFDNFTAKASITSIY